MPKKSIDVSIKDRCLQIASLAFLNPFTPERQARYRELFGENHDMDADEPFPELRKALEELIEKLGGEEAMDYRTYGAQDGEWIRILTLFAGYHRFYQELDAHLQREQDQTSPCAFSHGDGCMEYLQRGGFSEEEATWYVGVFYQLRRAHRAIREFLVGETSCMMSFKARLWSHLFTHDIRHYETCMWERMEDFSLLLVGETGTGKGNAAQAMGLSCYIPYEPKTRKFAMIPRAMFVATNLSQYSLSLVESELFGHRKGAFTGALKDHEGLFSRCPEYGMVFLDEIVEVPLTLQIKLLRLLQDREFSPVGSDQLLRFKGRVVAAASPEMDQALLKGQFREDFYYRLCSDRLALPPLRERLCESSRELPRLVSGLFRKMTGTQDKALLASVLRQIEAHAEHGWPGNVRELEQAIRQVLIKGFYEPLILPKESHSSVDQGMLFDSMGEASAEQCLAAYAQHLYRKHQSYEAVARILSVDRRTARKYVQLPAD